MISKIQIKSLKKLQNTFFVSLCYSKIFFKGGKLSSTSQTTYHVELKEERRKLFDRLKLSFTSHIYKFQSCLEFIESGNHKNSREETQKFLTFKMFTCWVIIYILNFCEKNLSKLIYCIKNEHFFTKTISSRP